MLKSFRCITLEHMRRATATHRTLSFLSKTRKDRESRDEKDAEEMNVCTVSECVIDCNSQPSVVIIGAGMAGLSAAQRLAQSGITNFTILEATERAGGRIHSCWLGDVIAEVGAQYIEGGCPANPVYNLACQEGLIGSPPLRRPCAATTGLFFTSDGRAIDRPVALAAYHSFRHVEQEASRLFDMGCGREHGTLLQFLSLRIQQQLRYFPEEQRHDAARVMHGLTNCVRYRCGDDLSMVSADQYGSYMAIPGGRLRVPLGYVGVIAPLLKELPPCTLHYCKPVDTVTWGALHTLGKRAVVKCCDGQNFEADYVIVTVPLGVLKMHASKMFCPNLSAEKVEAIKCLGNGWVSKVFFEYQKPFWAWNEGGVRLAWSPDELLNRCDWTRGLACIEEVEGSKHVLCSYISGPEAAQAELATDVEVAEKITSVLRQFTGDSTLPFPSTVLRSKWISDPFFGGSYSYLAVDSNVGHQCDLAAPLPGPCEPVAPILLFAGEATAVGHYSTVHGARLSGIREAERIVQLTKAHGGPPPQTKL